MVLETGANDGLRGLAVDSTRANIAGDHRSRARRSSPTRGLLLVQMEAPPNLGTRYTPSFERCFPSSPSGTGLSLLPFLLEGVAGVAR